MLSKKRVLGRIKELEDTAAKEKYETINLGVVLKMSGFIRPCDFLTDEFNSDKFDVPQEENGFNAAIDEVLETVQKYKNVEFENLAVVISIYDAIEKLRRKGGKR